MLDGNLSLFTLTMDGNDKWNKFKNVHESLKFSYGDDRIIQFNLSSSQRRENIFAKE